MGYWGWTDRCAEAAIDRQDWEDREIDRFRDRNPEARALDTLCLWLLRVWDGVALEPRERATHTSGRVPF